MATPGHRVSGSLAAYDCRPMPLHVRSNDPELLDGESLDPVQLYQNLREMAMLNRLPGGVGASVSAVGRLVGGRTDGSVLDVGAGFGDFARRLNRRHQVRMVLVDHHPQVLAIARRNLAGTDHVTFVQADARRLPLTDGSVDVAHASLLLHHLDPDDAVLALREMRRVARDGIVVNDLRRGRLAFALTATTVLTLTRGAYTRHDGVLSARRAYTLEELDALAARAGLSVMERRWTVFPRVITVYA